MPTTPAAEVARSLPSSLRLGAATASYQIEGSTQVDGRGQSIWDTFTMQDGRIADGSSGEPACDHYQRMPADVALMTELGLAVYRFSIAWPRIQPSGHGPVNEQGMDFYDRLVDTLLDAGIEPLPTLYHWDLPQVLEDAGGWPSRDLAGRFADYAHLVAQRLGDRVDRWATLNEPWVVAHLGYNTGVHAPGRQDPAAAMAAAHTLLRAHHLGDQAIRAASSTAQVGIALNLTTIRPDRDTAADEEAVRALDAIRNRWWLDGVVHGRLPEDAVDAWSAIDRPDLRDDDLPAGPPDWLGINYYFPEIVTTRADGEELPDACVSPARAVAPSGHVTAMGWRVDPGAFTELLTRVHRDYGPIPLVITENGAAYDDPDPVDGRVQDPLRATYLADHVLAVAAAIDQGVPVTDYLAWSLLDNFEWALGISKRFGIVHVDYDTQIRTIKDSGRWYAELIGEVSSGARPRP